jgi:exopolyphosphatase / guanosine-5'-triphosphate,3'-diphosphate pyrophosphatase
VNALTIRLGNDATLVDFDGEQHVVPIGAVTLGTDEFASDPPRPEELTNAIGKVVDHLDDMLRVLPGAADAEHIDIVGDLASVIAAVEFGGNPSLPFALPRAAAEDLFRTVATESSAERALNPGLPTDAVETIVAACCIVVALMRHLHLHEVDLHAHDDRDFAADRGARR